MKSPSRIKGDDLESSVEFIQRSVLESDPKFRGQPFTIERNEVVIAHGVRHELDLVVRVNPGTDYESCILFECKNWKKKIGKNEVIIFAGKISAVSATRGFIVGLNFSKDAIAQSKLEPRIRLLTCSSDFESLIGHMTLMHTQTDLLDIELSARVPDDAAPLAMDQLWMFNGQPITLGKFVKEQADRLYKDEFKRERKRLTLEGQHEGVAGGRFVFEPGELIQNTREIQWLELRCRYRITNTARKIRSKFDVHGYGRTYTFEPISGVCDGKALEMVIVERPKDKSKAPNA